MMFKVSDVFGKLRDDEVLLHFFEFVNDCLNIGSVRNQLFADVNVERLEDASYDIGRVLVFWPVGHRFYECVRNDVKAQTCMKVLQLFIDTLNVIKHGVIISRLSVEIWAFLFYHRYSENSNMKGASFMDLSWVKDWLFEYDKEPRHGSKKKNSTAMILCVLLGIFGAHRFYVGRWKTGILYMFTAGGLCVGLVLDIMAIALGVFEDKHGHFLHQNWPGIISAILGIADIIAIFVIFGPAIIFCMLCGSIFLMRFLSKLV